MGNRADLLAAAKRCLIERGYASTTARDIAEVAGVSLAAIGYHFSSTEALLTAALIESMDEWRDKLERALVGAADPGQGPLEQFEAKWTTVVELLREDPYPWAASFQFLAQIDYVPELREWLTSGMEYVRLGLAGLFQNVAPEDEDAPSIGSFYQALLNGLMIQWLVDEDNALTGNDVARGLRRILDSVAPTDSGTMSTPGVSRS